MARTVTLRVPDDHRRVSSSTSRLAALGAALRSYWTGPVNLKDPALNRLFGAGARSAAGPAVTEHTMFTCAAVLDAVNQIASDVAKLPLNLKKRRKEAEGGGSDDYIESKTYRLLKYAPNPEMRSMVFRRTMMVHALVGTAGFAEIERDMVGRPSALWIIEPHRVQPFYDMGATLPDGRRDPLRYRVDGQEIFEERDLLKIHGVGWDGVVGFEMVQVAREAIGLALASQQFASAFFGNGTRFGGVLSSDQDLDPEQKNDIRNEIEKLYAKADKAFRTLVLEAGFKYEQVGVKPNDAQMKEIRDQQVMEAARFYNMPLHKLKLAMPGAVSYASVEMADLDYYKGTLLNWITLWEEELNAKLVPPLELGLQYFKHNANAFLRGDIKSRYDALGIARDKGIINADEWRELEDMNPQPNGQGKIYLVQQAMIPADLLPELVRTQIEKAKAPPPAPNPPAPKGQEDSPDGTGMDDRERHALLERIRAAEQLASEAHAREVTAREDLARADASGVAVAEERDRLQGVVLAQVSAAAQYEEIADLLRSKLPPLEAERDAARAQLSEVERQRAELQATLQAAVDRAEATEAARRMADEAARTAAERAGAADAERDAARQREIEAEARATAAVTDREAALVAQEAARCEAQAAQEAVNAAQAESDAARQALEAATREARTAKEEADRLVAEAEARASDASTRAEAATQALLEADRRVAALETEVAEQRARVGEQEAACAALLAQLGDAQQASAAERAALEEQLTAREQARDQAQQLLSAREAELAAAQQAHTAAAGELRTVHAAEKDRRVQMIARLRRNIEAAVGRMVRREVQQARSKQATPEKLRRWLSTFATLHEDAWVEQVTDPIGVYLAWRQSDEDPATVTRTTAQAHIALFEAQLRAVLEGDPDAFHVLLERTLTQWEHERAAAIADAFLTEAVRHVQEQ